jgi:hypothetical protein
MIDSVTEDIIASSFQLPYYDNKSNKLIKYSDSENKLVIETINKLKKEKWSIKDLYIDYSHYILYTRFQHGLINKTIVSQDDNNILLENNQQSNIYWRVIVLSKAGLTYSYLGSSSPFFYICIVISSLTIFISVMAFSFLYTNSKLRTVQLTIPHLTMLITSGGVLLGVFGLVLLGKNTNITCTLRPYFLGIGATTFFCPLVEKSLFIHLQFNHYHIDRRYLRKLSMKEFLKKHGRLTFILILIDVLIITVTLYANGQALGSAVTKSRYTANSAYEDLTYCAYDFRYATAGLPLYAAQMIYICMNFTTVAILSFLNRRMPDAIAASNAILVIIFMVGVISILTAIAVTSFDDIDKVILIQVLGISLCVWIGLGQLLIPLTHSILILGDVSAANSIVNTAVERVAVAKAAELSPHRNDLNKPSSAVAQKRRSFLNTDPAAKDLPSNINSLASMVSNTRKSFGIKAMNNAAVHPIEENKVTLTSCAFEYF